MHKDYFVLATPTVQRTKVVFVPVGDIHKFHGFRSVYLFARSEVDEIERQGHMRRISHLPVHAVELFVDFDNQRAAAERFRVYLLAQNVMFNEYDSGRRSVHFHIMTQPISGPNVPYSQLMWMRRHAQAFDTTIYRHTGLFRLPGTYHEKAPGQRKTMVGTYGRYPLYIPLVERRLIPVPAILNTHEAATKLVRASTREQSEGGRRVHAWYLAAMAHDAGKDRHETYDIVLTWNQQYAIPPLDEAVVIAKVDEAFDARMLDSVAGPD